MQQFVQVRHQQQIILNDNIEDEQTTKLKQQMKKLQRQVQQLQKMQLINKQKDNINQLTNVSAKKLIKEQNQQEQRQMKIDKESKQKKQQINETIQIKQGVYSYKTQSVNEPKDEYEQFSFRKVKHQSDKNQLKSQIQKIDIKNSRIKNLVKELSNNPQNRNILHSQSKVSQNEQNLIKNEKRIPFLIRQLRSKSQINKNNNISFYNTGSNFNSKKTPILNMAKLRGLNNDISSNLFNLSIGDIMEIQKNNQVSNLISQVEYLKGKKSQSNMKINSQNHIQIKTFRSSQQNINKLENKRENNELNTQIQLKSGRIYQRSKLFPHQHQSIKNSRIKNLQQKSHVDIQDQLYSIQLKKNPNRLAWNPQMRLTSRNSELKRPDFNGKMYSRLNIMNRNYDQENNKKQQIQNRDNFNYKLVKKQNQQSKRSSRRSLVNKLEKQQQSINISDKQHKLNSDQQDNLLKYQKLQQIRQHKQILRDFISDYKCYIQKLLLRIELPFYKFHLYSFSTVEQLNIIGKQYFMNCFGMTVQLSQNKSQYTKLFQQNKINHDNNNINKGKDANNTKYEYHIAKYSNCVHFRLNNQYNMICYFNGQFYFGGWEINLIGQGSKQGFGIQIMENQQKIQIYQGYYKNNKRNGYGISYFIDKNNINSESNPNHINNPHNNINKQVHFTIYSGQWQSNLKHCHGYQLSQNIQYVGQFLQDKCTGNAKIKYHSQQQQSYYQGQLVDGIKQGIGKQILFNKDVYYGEFRSNKYYGKGEYLWNNGSYFYGQFVYGQRKGYGIWIQEVNLISQNNKQQSNQSLFDIYVGNYDYNIKNGYGIYRWSNGNIYKGYFKNDLRDGQGLMQVNNHYGKIAKYMWKQGKKLYKIYSQQQQNYRIHNRHLSFDNYASVSEKDDIYDHLIDKDKKYINFNEWIKILIEQLGKQKLQLLPKTALGKLIYKGI